MNTNESIALIAAVAAVAYWWGKKQATRTQTTTQADPLGWLGGWAQT